MHTDSGAAFMAWPPLRPLCELLSLRVFTARDANLLDRGLPVDAMACLPPRLRHQHAASSASTTATTTVSATAATVA